MTDAIGPGATRTATFTGAPSGRTAAQLTLEVLDAAGAAERAASGAGLVEIPTGAGTSTYTIAYPAPLVAGTYIERWRDTVPNPDVVVDTEIDVSWSALAPPPGPAYATPDALRAELQLTPAQLDDDAANRTISAAEDLVDDLIGAWPINTATGRKLTVGDLDGWQALKLQQATVTIGAVLKDDPRALEPARYGIVNGPDFGKRAPVAGGINPAARVALRRAASLLDAAGLRVLTARATTGGARRLPGTRARAW